MIALDVHDVLGDYVLGMIYRYGTPMGAWTSDLRTLWPTLNLEEHFEQHNHDAFLEMVPVIDGAVFSMWRLKSMGIPFIYHTATPPTSRRALERWFDKAGFPLQPLVMGNKNAGKIANMLELEGITAVIDDQPEILEAAADMGIKTYVFDRPWNHDMAFGTRIMGWAHGIWQIRRDLGLDSWEV